VTKGLTPPSMLAAILLFAFWNCACHRGWELVAVNLD